ncbi:hypothetical protein HDU67_009869 [Dinochytrium kinnereticum]|nr:hypothetical protein HDU67_009869 [Dinochytrium kinnereticum]
MAGAGPSINLRPPPLILPVGGLLSSFSATPMEIEEEVDGPRKRKQVKNACVNCQKACKKCDNGRPCPRCVRYGLQSSCQDSVRKERRKGIKRGPYKPKADSESSSRPNSPEGISLPGSLLTSPNGPLEGGYPNSLHGTVMSATHLQGALHRSQPKYQQFAGRHDPFIGPIIQLPTPPSRLPTSSTAPSSTKPLSLLPPPQMPGGSSTAPTTPNLAKRELQVDASTAIAGGASKRTRRRRTVSETNVPSPSVPASADLDKKAKKMIAEKPARGKRKDEQGGTVPTASTDANGLAPVKSDPSASSSKSAKEKKEEEDAWSKLHILSQLCSAVLDHSKTDDGTSSEGSTMSKSEMEEKQSASAPAANYPYVGPSVHWPPAATLPLEKHDIPAVRPLPSNGSPPPNEWNDRSRSSYSVSPERDFRDKSSSNPSGGETTSISESAQQAAPVSPEHPSSTAFSMLSITGNSRGGHTGADSADSDGTPPPSSSHNARVATISPQPHSSAPGVGYSVGATTVTVKLPDGYLKKRSNPEYPIVSVTPQDSPLRGGSGGQGHSGPAGEIEHRLHLFGQQQQPSPFASPLPGRGKEIHGNTAGRVKRLTSVSALLDTRDRGDEEEQEEEKGDISSRTASSSSSSLGAQLRPRVSRNLISPEASPKAGKEAGTAGPV